MITEAERKKKEEEERRRRQRAGQDDITNPLHPANPVASPATKGYASSDKGERP